MNNLCLISVRSFGATLLACLLQATGASSLSAAQASDLPYDSVFAADPYHEGVFYLATGDSAGLLRSSDGGVTWTSVGLAAPLRRLLVLQNRVYASDGESLYTSADGHLWIQGGIPMLSTGPRPIDYFDASPLASDIVYGGQSAIFRSGDAGAHWTPAGPPAFAYDVRTDPNSSLVYVSTDAGIFKSADGGQTWNRLIYPFTRGSGFPFFDPSRPNVLYIKHVPYPSPCTSIDCVTLLRSDDNGVSWTAMTTPDTDFSMQVAPDGTLYLRGLNRSLYVSDDQGASWRLSVSGLSSPVGLVTFSSSAPFVFTQDRQMFSSSDNGRSWFRVAGARRSCGSDPTELCLGGLFALRLTYRLLDGEHGLGQAVPMVPQSGGFWFFTPDNVDVVAKMINGPEVDTPYWFFIGSLTNLEYDVTVTDLDSGLTRQYSNPQGFISSVVDLAAFDGTTANSVSSTKTMRAARREVAKRPNTQRSETEAGTCATDFRTLCLQNDRFAVTSSSLGLRFKTSSSGAFVLAHQDILEIVLKVVDGRSLNGHFWVFVGALTDQPYDLTIVDTVTGVTWTHQNPIGHLESFADISAFPN